MSAKQDSLDNQQRQTAQLPGNWVSADFHVHTPASPDYVRIANQEIPGPTESDYYNFLECLAESDVAVVALTDHNSIEGYDSLLRLRDDLDSTIATLRAAGEEIPPIIQSRRSFFDKCVLLPGVELDIEPNLHFLVLFDPQLGVEMMDAFITDAGFPPERRWKEDSSRHASWGVGDLYRRTAASGAILIAAHADSSKGLYEASKDWGQKRIAAFTANELFAIEFNRPESREQILSILAQPDYARTTRIAFVQGSDFHAKTGQKIGDHRTWIRIDSQEFDDRYVFEGLRKAFRNPDEFVSSPGSPEVEEIKNRLSGMPFVANVESVDEKSRLAKLVCALSNTRDGTIVVGRNKRGNWKGITTANHEVMLSLITTAVTESVSPAPIFGVEIYEHFPGNVFATVHISHAIEISSTLPDDEVFEYKNHVAVKAGLRQVIEMAESSVIQRYRHLSISPRIEAMSKKISSLRDSIEVIPIVRKIEKRTESFATAFDFPKFCSPLSDSQRRDIDFRDNGCAEGNLLLIDEEPPRGPEHYIRFSAPLGNMEIEDLEKSGFACFDGEKLIFSPHGAIYYDARDSIVIVGSNCRPLVVLPDKSTMELPAKFAFAYLKSAISIWYADRFMLDGIGTPSFRHALILRVPASGSGDRVSDIVEIVDTIIEREHRFLESIEGLEYGSPSAAEDAFAERERLRVEHNSSIEPLMADLDSSFYQYIGLTKEEISFVNSALVASERKIFR